MSDFNQLINSLSLSSNNNILFTNRDFNSNSFVFDLLLQYFVKKGNQILLILLSNNWTHYKTIAAKCGISLKTAEDKGLIRVIDVLSGHQFSFNQLMTDLEKQLNHLSSDSLIITDDLSHLFSLNVNSTQIYRFVHKLKVESSLKSQILAIGSHFPHEDDDQEVHQLISSIAHKSDIWLEIDKTKTGYSSLISGSLKIHKRNDNSSQEMNYKISGRSVKLLTLGSNLL